MGRADWAVMNGSVDGTTWDGTTILRNASFGLPTPPGGSPAVFGFNSVQVLEGAVGISCQVAGFAPISTGGEIQGALSKGISGGVTGFSAFLFIGATGNNVTDRAYMLGFENNDPFRICIAKGMLQAGIPNEDTSLVKILRRGSQRYNQGDWVHLKLDMIVQGSGDVVLRAYQNDLSLYPLDNPSNWHWTEIPFDDDWNSRFGDGYFIDDATGVNSGSTPFTSGYVGFGFQTKDTARRAYFDHIAIYQQA